MQSGLFNFHMTEATSRRIITQLRGDRAPTWAEFHKAWLKVIAEDNAKAIAVLEGKQNYS